MDVCMYVCMYVWCKRSHFQLKKMNTVTYIRTCLTSWNATHTYIRTYNTSHTYIHCTYIKTCIHTYKLFIDQLPFGLNLDELLLSREKTCDLANSTLSEMCLSKAPTIFSAPISQAPDTFSLFTRITSRWRSFHTYVCMYVCMCMYLSYMYVWMYACIKILWY